MQLRNRSMGQALAAVSVLLALVAAATVARACTCLDVAPGFRMADRARLPLNAVGVPWVGEVRDSSHAARPPVAGDFRLEVRDGSFWRTLGVVVVESPDLAQARKGNDERIVLVGPRGGFRPGAFYRVSSSLPAERNTVEFAVAERSFRVAKRKASAVVAPVVRGSVVAAAGAGCSTEFAGASTTVRLVLPETLEPFRDALLFALVDGQGRLWRPDSSVCERTPIGGNSLGPGHERLFAPCGDSFESERPTESLPGGDLEFEFVAWLPGTTERIAAKVRLALQCAEKGR